MDIGNWLENCQNKLKQVGSPTKARAGFFTIGLPPKWEAAVGFIKGIVIFFDHVCKGQVGKLGLTRPDLTTKGEFGK